MVRLSTALTLSSVKLSHNQTTIFSHCIPTDISNVLNFMTVKANNVCPNHICIYTCNPNISVYFPIISLMFFNVSNILNK